MPEEAHLLEQVRWILALLKRLGMLDYTRIHVMPILRGSPGRRPIFSKNVDMKGFSDIEVVVPPHGRVGYAELKSSRGKLSEEQEVFQEGRRRMGAPCWTINTFEDFVAFLRGMGVPVDGVLKGTGSKHSGGGRDPADPA